jgi:hypothetical protein
MVACLDKEETKVLLRNIDHEDGDFYNAGFNSTLTWLTARENFRLFAV